MPQADKAPNDSGKRVDVANVSLIYVPRARKRVEVRGCVDLASRLFPTSAPTAVHAARRLGVWVRLTLASATNCSGHLRAQLYDASTTSTEYTRALRVKENRDEEQRRSCRARAHRGE